MEYDLMTEEDFETLPEDPQQKFVAIETLCRRSMNRLISESTPPAFDQLVRMQYMTTVSAAASELGIEGVVYPDHLDDPSAAIDRFLLAASAATTRIRLRSASSRAHSVRLSARSRGRIELQLRRLREAIDNAEMADEKRRRLLEKLSELADELDHNRVSFARTFALLAYLSLGVTTTTSFLADAPEAIATITSLIGQEKEAEDTEARRLGPPPTPKALPAPAAAPPATWSDDDIPF